MVDMIKLTATLPPSVNHAYYTANNGMRILTDKAKNWMEEVGFFARVEMRKQKWRYSEDEKIVMELTVYWPDNKRRDMSNLHKLLADAWEKILYKDDKMLLIRDMDFSVDRKNPRVEVLIYRKGA